MAAIAVGYQRLIAQYHLPALPLAQIARIDTRVKGRKSTEESGTDLLLFESRYAPDSTIEADLQFALRYEGVNLEVLALLYARTGPQPFIDWLVKTPESGYARRAGFLYEWLTGTPLSIPPLSARTSYEPVLDESRQFGISAAGEKIAKFRVRNNLPGTREFCPLVRKTAALMEMARKNLAADTQEILSAYEPALLRRAAQYLFLKETHSSYEVEHEKPSAGRVQRFVQLLRNTSAGQPLSQERFVALQNEVLEPRWHEFAYRHRQNWVGSTHHNHPVVDFVPPRPEDVVSLMNGLCQFSERGRNSHRLGNPIDAVVHSAAVAFGFVFVHPFMDGNGRLHRYLIHDELTALGFTPKGIVLPVSAFILNNMEPYVETLERFSRPRLMRTEFEPQLPDAPARGNDAVYFRYFDATAQALFLYRALAGTVGHDLRTEIDYLVGMDRAREQLRHEMDWPGQSLDLFINIVRHGGGKLSATKRKSEFGWMTDAEIQSSTLIVNQAFGTLPNQQDPSTQS